MTRALLSGLALIGLCVAQDQPLATVEGKVTDALSHLPIANAYLALVRTDRTVISSAVLGQLQTGAGDHDPRADAVAVLTDEQGDYRFRVQAPVKFMLLAVMEGYVAEPQGNSPRHEAAAGATKTVDVSMTRELGISGRVIDAGTEKPVKGLQVRAMSYRQFGPRRILLPIGPDEQTDEEGRFALTKLVPGDYYLETLPPLRAAIGEPKPVPDFRRAVQLTYSSTWYPGVVRQQEAIPVKLVAGAPLQGIEIEVKKRRTAAVRGSVVGEEAVGDISVMLGHARHGAGVQSYSAITSGKLKSGAGFEVDHLAPGAYFVLADAMGRNGERLAADLVFEVGEENMDGLHLVLGRGATIAGTVRIAGKEQKSGEPALPAGATLSLKPLVRISRQEDRPVTVDAQDGSFRMQGVTAGQYYVLAGLLKLPGYGISEVTYDGKLCPNGLMSVVTDGEEHRLEVKLAPAVGSVVANATDGVQDAPGALVLLIPEPVNDAAFSHLVKYAEADANGRATITGLLPGTYRVAAYPAGTDAYGDPQIRDRLAGGQEVRVGQHPAQVQLRVQAPR